MTGASAGIELELAAVCAEEGLDMPGTNQAVYNGTKPFVDSFSFALRAELKDTGVTLGR